MGKLIKKCLLGLLVVMCACCIMKIDTYAATERVSDDGLWGYTLEFGKAKVSAYYGDSANIVVPSVIDGATVVGVEHSVWSNEPWFARHLGTAEYVSIELPDTVKELPSYCFDGCKKLVSIRLSNQMTVIPDGCFRDCVNLRTVSNYGNVTKLGWDVFADCESLEAFDMSKIELMDGRSCFSNCKSLKCVEFSPKLQTITCGSFSGCESLEQIKFAEGLKVIEAWAFEKCYNLQSIDLPSTLTRFDSYGVFSECKSLTSVTIPSNVERLGGLSFKECTALKKFVTLGSTSLGFNDFIGCSALEIVKLGNGVKLGGATFENCINLREIYIPSNCEVSVGEFVNCEVLQTIYGFAGSPAEAFANQYGITFKKLTDFQKLSFSKVDNKAYTGKAITPSVTVKSGKKELKKGVDYTVKYSNNKKIGQAKITISGLGNYIGEKVIYFNIVPKETSITSIASKKKGTINVSMKKVSDAAGYLVSYSLKKDSGFKTVTWKSNSGTISGLKSGKTYYVKVTTYKTIVGKKQSPKYSAVKSVKVK